MFSAEKGNFYSCMERSYVRMISTISQTLETDKMNRKSGEMIWKPENIMDYNMYMNGVDLADII